MSASRSASSARRFTSAKPPYHHGNLRAAMIEAAAALVEEVGAEHVTVREAARRAGVSPGAPFRHFPTRKALMTAVAEEGMIRLGNAVDDRLSKCRSTHPLVRLMAIATGYVDWAVQSPAHYRVVGDRKLIDFDGSEILSGGARKIRAEMSAIFQEAGRQGILRDSDIERVHFQSRALSYGLARMHVDGHLREWNIPKSKARRAMIDAFREYIIGLARDTDAARDQLEKYSIKQNHSVKFSRILT